MGDVPPPSAASGDAASSSSTSPSSKKDSGIAARSLSPHAQSFIPNPSAHPQISPRFMHQYAVPAMPPAYGMQMPPPHYGAPMMPMGDVRRASSAPSAYIQSLHDGSAQRSYTYAVPLFVVPPMIYSPPPPQMYAMAPFVLPESPVPPSPMRPSDSPASSARRNESLGRVRESFLEFAKKKATADSSAGYVPPYSNMRSATIGAGGVRRFGSGEGGTFAHGPSGPPHAAGERVERKNSGGGEVVRRSSRPRAPFLGRGGKQQSMPNMRMAPQPAPPASTTYSPYVHLLRQQGHPPQHEPAFRSSPQPQHRGAAQIGRGSSSGRRGENGVELTTAIHRFVDTQADAPPQKGDKFFVKKEVRAVGSARKKRSTGGEQESPPGEKSGKKRSRKKGGAHGKAKKRALEECMKAVEGEGGLYKQEELVRQLAMLEDLMEREQVVGKTHLARVRHCNTHGMVVDLIITDESRLSPMTFDCDYRDEGMPDNCYVWRNAIIPWSVFPNVLFQGIERTEDLAKHTLHLIPPGSTFKAYAYQKEDVLVSIDESGNEVHKFVPSLKMARRPYPTLQFHSAVNTKTACRVPTATLMERFTSQEELIEFFAENGAPLSANVGPRSGQRFQYMVVIDFEATCDFSFDPVVDHLSSEIIEFPWVVLDVASREVVHSERYYVRPENLGGITKYCTALTGISPETCSADSAISLSEALKKFDDFVAEFLLPNGEDCFCIVTDSRWDLSIQLHTEARRKGIPLKPWYRRFIDVKAEFRRIWRWFPFSTKEPPLFVMLQAMGLPFVGRHHSGLDDCKTIVQLIQVMLQLDPSSYTREQLIEVEDDYDPFSDPTWTSYMGQAPPDSWCCPACQVFNKPHLTVCQFCNASKGVDGGAECE